MDGSAPGRVRGLAIMLRSKRRTWRKPFHYEESSRRKVGSFCHEKAQETRSLVCVGRAVIFKTVNKDQYERRSDFSVVSSDLSLSDARDLLITRTFHFLKQRRPVIDSIHHAALGARRILHVRIDAGFA